MQKIAKMKLFKNLFLHVLKDESCFQVVRLDYFINFTRNIITQVKRVHKSEKEKSQKCQMHHYGDILN